MSKETDALAEEIGGQIRGSMWNHAVPILSVILAGLSALFAFRSGQTARVSNKIDQEGNKINVEAVDTFQDANKIAMIAAIREASVNARLLLEDPKYTINGMDFSYLRFSTYRFPNKDMQRVDFSHCNMSWAKLKKSKLGGAILKQTNLWGADLREAEIWGANLNQADMRDSQCQNANLRGAKLLDAQLEGANFQGADLRGAQLNGASLGALQVQNLTFRGTASDEAKEQVLKKLTKNTDLRGADLRGAILDKTIFGGVIYDAKTQWPKGFKPPASAQNSTK
jgi:uncharacterized protein YjbI with pentapeptide repeats